MVQVVTPTQEAASGDSGACASPRLQSLAAPKHKNKNETQSWRRKKTWCQCRFEGGTKRNTWALVPAGSERWPSLPVLNNNKHFALECGLLSRINSFGNEFRGMKYVEVRVPLHACWDQRTTLWRFQHFPGCSGSTSGYYAHQLSHLTVPGC